MMNIAEIRFKRYQQHLYCLLAMLLITLNGFSQNVGINATGAPPDGSAGLDVNFSDKGVLIPRVALTGTASFAPLSAHVPGMIVYNTATVSDVVPGFYYDNGTKWVAGFPSGNAVGDILYWNGTGWITIPRGTAGQYLQISSSNIPVWGSLVPVVPSIITTAASAITGISATSGANITSDGGSPILSRGVCWKTSSGPTIADSKTVDGSGIGTFVSSLTGLLPVTTYYVRAYAVNSTVNNYGNEITFTTTAVLPAVTTTTATAITGTTATGGGNVTNTGGATITERGICYATTANPTTANLKVVDPAPGAGAFVSNLTGLTGYTTYFVRAYAINSIGTSYGTQVSFTTTTIPPTLVTVPPTSIMSTTVISGGTMSWNGGGYSNYQAYGVAYATTPNATSPTRAVTNSANGPVNPLVNISPWVTNITGLASNTTYYIRSFLDIYPSGTGPWITVYGNELSFTTALVQTSPISTITNTTAVSGGTIGAVSGITITARGVCWSTTTGPTLANNFTSDGSGTGTFVSNLTGLADLTTYYLRAYSTDNLGNTVYGNEVSFVTGTPRAIGDALAGGKVIYVDITGQHGLIGALVDQGTAVQWGCYGTTTGATGSALFTGLSNTNLIVAACGAGTAAQLCASYTAGGLNLPGITNWYLPSKDEFQQLINQKVLIGLTTSCGVNGCFYWTSTEYNSAIAYLIPSILVSPSYNNYKNTSNYVRAIRAF